MTYQDIVNLFGHSELSTEVKVIFQKLHIPEERPEMLICWRRFQSDKWDLSLTFRAKNNYKSDYGPVIKEYATDYEESFLEEINFGGTGKGIHYPYALPYDLKWGDSIELVLQKIPIKKSESKTASYGSYMVFNGEDYWILTAFDNDKKLIWIRLKLHEQSFKRKRELTKSLRQQNKNLSVLNINDFKLLKQNSPTSAWKQRMIEGDDNFSVKNIEDSEKLISAFIDSLLVAVEQKKASSIHSATRKIVKGFNKLSEKYPGFVETLEREELVGFIHHAIQMTGFTIEQDIDLTEEWREW